MKKILFYAASLFLLGTSTAQTTTGTDSSVSPVDVVVVQKDDRIKEIMKKKITGKNSNSGGSSSVKTKSGISKETAEKLKSTERVKVDRWGNVRMPGYRVQVMNSTDRAAVYAMKGKLMASYPGQRCYVVNQTPFFKLRFGNFVNKADAEKYRKALAPMFPSGVNVVNDIVETRVKITKEVEVPKKTSSTNVTSKSSTSKSGSKTVAKPTTKPKAPTKPKTTAKPKTSN